jgi:protein SCO1/2
VLVLGATGAVAWWRHDSAGSAPAALRGAPDFAFTDQDGRTVTRADLIGKIWIADFIFTQCRSACPLLTARMKMLQNRITNPELRFISFSVDPEHDTSAVLKRYAAQWSGDEARWRLLQTDADGLRAVTTGMRLLVAATGDPSDPILHSNRFLLFDRKGTVRGAYDSSDTAAMARLVTDAQALLGHSVTPQLAAQSGEALFGRLGCRGCHDRSDVAPPLGLRLQPPAGQTWLAPARPPPTACVRGIPILGGLHHRYGTAPDDAQLAG